MPPRALQLLIVLVIAIARGEGAELAFAMDVAPGAEQRLAIGPLACADVLELDYHRDHPPLSQGRSTAALEVVLVTCDQRYFSLAEPFEADDSDGEADLPLDAAHWGSSEGLLGPDALASVCAVIVRVHAEVRQGRISGTLSIHPCRRDAPTGLVLADGGLVDRGPWRELAVRLIGERPIEDGEVELVEGARRWPLFLDQPGRVVDGAFRALGPARWVLRLSPGEAPTGSVRWTRDGRLWSSQPLPRLGVVRAVPLGARPPHALAVPTSPSWIGRRWEVRGGAGALLPRALLKACAAPILSWNRAWTGFRGATLVSWSEAAACDRLLAQGVEEIDLCPQCMLEEHGTFRLGLSPWAAPQGGPWTSERDAWTTDDPWSQWRAHMRAVLARARAAPGLARWRLGVTAVATGGQEQARLRDFLSAASALVADGDGRPLEILHPQAVDYAYDDAKVRAAQGGCWFSFEDSHQDWQEGPRPLFTASAFRDTASASDGLASLAIPLAVALDQGAVLAGGAFVDSDSDLFNLDQLRLDAQVAGDGACQLYIWVTDDHHHWFQQRLALVPGDGRWRTVIADFSDEAEWTGAASGTRWGAAVRRRVRRLGICGFFHPGDSARAGGAPSPLLRIDHVCRYGWATMAPPALGISMIAAPAERVPLWEPLRADFTINVETSDPYDPDQADVVGEVEGADGTRLSWPAYWAEPVRLDFRDGVETPVPEGEGMWHWRFTPPHAGTWRWRLRARIRWRDRLLEAATRGRTAQTAPARADPMPPIRVSSRDPQCFETLDGTPYYPLGLTLRSPGDTRQVDLTKQLPRPAALGDPNDLDRPLVIGDKGEEEAWERMGTRAYERWFGRMRENGMNWARVWMTSWWCGLEWSRDLPGFGGLTWYNQADAACLDRVMELARQDHVYLQIELLNHGAVSETVDPEWENCPYNAANGGMCGSAQDFFTNDAAFTATTKRYRYTLARWGWQSQVAAWVLCSELEWTAAWWNETGRNEDGGSSPAVAKWVRASLDWFKAHEAWARPVSVHFSHPWNGSTLWPMEGLGFNNSNCYSGFQDMNWGPPRLGGDGSGRRDLPLALELYLSQCLPPWRYHRPTIIGEWGGHWQDNDARVLAQELHAGLWLQAVLPYAGDTGFWWWLWVDGDHRWGEFKRGGGFLAGHDRRGLGWRICKPSIRGGAADVSGLGMVAQTQIRLYFWLTHLDQQAGLRDDRAAGTARLESGNPDSTWRCERWSPTTGTLASTTTLSADHDGVVLVPLDVMHPDAAFRLSAVARR